MQKFHRSASLSWKSLEFFVRQIASPVAVLNADGIVLTSNDAFESLIHKEDFRKSLSIFVKKGDFFNEDRFATFETSGASISLVAISLVESSGKNINDDNLDNDLKRVNYDEFVFLCSVVSASWNELLDVAFNDSLTGLGNRYSATQFLSKSPPPLDDSTVDGRSGSGSFVLCDIDHFKRVNDRFGHSFGDDVLVLFAQTIRKFFRQNDLIARIGGDEFVVFCPECPTAIASRRTERFLNELQKITEQPKYQEIALSASFGVVPYRTPVELDSLVQKADPLLYQMKRSRQFESK